jgi:hypothetical protein
MTAAVSSQGRGILPVKYDSGRDLMVMFDGSESKQQLRALLLHPDGMGIVRAGGTGGQGWFNLSTVTPAAQKQAAAIDAIIGAITTPNLSADDLESIALTGKVVVASGDLLSGNNVVKHAHALDPKSPEGKAVLSAARSLDSYLQTNGINTPQD